MDLDRAEKIADRLFVEKHVSPRWVLGWDDDPYNLAVGETNFNNYVVSFNRPIIAINNEDVFVETVLHEFAHTFVGPREDHGPKWQRCARQLGATISVEHGMMPDGVVKPTPELKAKIDAYNQMAKLIGLLEEREETHQYA